MAEQFQVVGVVSFANGDTHSETSYGLFPTREEAQEKRQAVRTRQEQSPNRDANEHVIIRRIQNRDAGAR